MVGPHGGGRDLRPGVCHPADLDRGTDSVLVGAQPEEPQCLVKKSIEQNQGHRFLKSAAANAEQTYFFNILPIILSF